MPNAVTPPAPPTNTLHVLVTREPFIEYFTLTLDNGHTEELEVEDCKQWFKDRGADMAKVDKALDHCWNFYRVEIVLKNSKEPPLPALPYAPRL